MPRGINYFVSALKKYSTNTYTAGSVVNEHLFSSEDLKNGLRAL